MKDIFGTLIFSALMAAGQALAERPGAGAERHGNEQPGGRKKRPPVVEVVPEQAAGKGQEGRGGKRGRIERDEGRRDEAPAGGNRRREERTGRPERRDEGEGRGGARGLGQQRGHGQERAHGQPRRHEPLAVPGRLKELGVRQVPVPPREGRGLLATSRAHSVIPFPDQGPGGMRLTQKALSPRRFNDPLVRSHMALVSKGPLVTVVAGFEAQETVSGRYYWHRDGGFDYCHYYDAWGYHWYGWYVGASYFWTRRHQGRWWWYDADNDRWCYWSGGWWWWPGPSGVVFLYDGDRYVKAGEGGRIYRSRDGSRLVRVLGEDQDAFLYDNSDEPAFDPVFLDFGVEKVKFSRERGGPLQVMLTLDDGSVRIFDERGRALEFEEAEED